jgi:hypothetical protein
MALTAPDGHNVGVIRRTELQRKFSDGLGEIARRKVRVMLFGHARVRVAEIMRDNVQGNAGHDHMARRRVTDNMEPGRRRDVRRAAGLGHQESAIAWPPWLPGRPREHQVVARVARGERFEKSLAFVS